MRKLPGILIHIFVGCSMLSAQNSVPQIENIRMDMTDNQLEIWYDITGSPAGTLHQVDFVVVDNMGNIIVPDSVSGDVGSSVVAGNDHMIVWEIYKEFDVVYGDFSPRLTIDATDNKRQLRGPEYAALSLLVPGLGDYFVADVSEMKIKPYYKTAFTAGILGLSWAALRNRHEIPPVMNPPGWYYTMHSPDPIYIDHEWLYKIALTDYWLFPHDAEILLGIGIGSWLFDVIWVTRKGVENNKIRNSLLEHVSMVPVHRGLLLCYRKQF